MHPALRWYIDKSSSSHQAEKAGKQCDPVRRQGPKNFWTDWKAPWILRRHLNPTIMLSLLMLMSRMTHIICSLLTFFLDICKWHKSQLFDLHGCTMQQRGAAASRSNVKGPATVQGHGKIHLDQEMMNVKREQNLILIVQVALALVKNLKNQKTFHSSSLYPHAQSLLNGIRVICKQQKTEETGPLLWALKLPMFHIQASSILIKHLVFNCMKLHTFDTKN